MIFKIDTARLSRLAMVFVAVRHHRRAREARYHHICELTRVDFE